jgi:hypothetical protein
MATRTENTRDTHDLSAVDDGSQQRGRKRRRSSNIPPSPRSILISHISHDTNPSGESTTLRGRGRRRSNSPSHSPLPSPDNGRICTRSTSPPGRKYQKKSPKAGKLKRRSQSPSRSRSKNAEGTPRRRRQRTRSRSRGHQLANIPWILKDVNNSNKGDLGKDEGKEGGGNAEDKLVAKVTR